MEHNWYKRACSFRQKLQVYFIYYIYIAICLYIFIMSCPLNGVNNKNIERTR